MEPQNPFSVLPTMSVEQTHFGARVQAMLLGPDAAAHRRRETYDGLTRSQILAALWNSAAPWRGQPPTRTEEMTEPEAETILVGRTVYGQGGRVYVAVSELYGRTVPLRFTADTWQTSGYDLYQDQEGLLDKVLAQLRTTGAVTPLPHP